MKQYIAQMALVVRDYDEAIGFYCGKLGFTLVEDTKLTSEKRWVRIAPPGSTGKEACLLLARAVGEEQLQCVGRQTGGRVFLFLYTDDFYRDYHRYLEKGVVFVEQPREEAYGTVAVFKDLYGNLWDLMEVK
jgi:catechol 2,3-dioxygenase-like lactoylglutathione lyase family enzyme